MTCQNVKMRAHTRFGSNELHLRGYAHYFLICLGTTPTPTINIRPRLHRHVFVFIRKHHLFRYIWKCIPKGIDLKTLRFLLRANGRKRIRKCAFTLRMKKHPYEVKSKRSLNFLWGSGHTHLGCNIGQAMAWPAWPLAHPLQRLCSFLPTYWTTAHATTGMSPCSLFLKWDFMHQAGSS